MASEKNWRLKLIACASLLALAAPALAQQANSRVINDQLQWGDVFATMNVTSRDGVGSITAAALATGNTTSAANTTDALSLTSNQTMSGATFATATIDADDAPEAAIAVASAQGNALEAQTEDGDLELDGRQTSDGGDVVATARANVRNTGLLSVAANAAANNMALDARNGDMHARIEQDAQNSIFAVADADACCSGQSVIGASAAANAFSTTSYTSTVSADYRQRSTGAQVYSSADIYQPSAGDVTVAATAAGNSANIANQYGYAAIRGRQENVSTIKAETRATLPRYEGVAVASAYGVGNTTLATNVGSDLAVDVQQLNTGGVDADVTFTAGSTNGGEAIVNATAIGNAFTGYVCSYCGDAAVSGAVNQTNGGDVAATGQIRTTATGALTGTASAIGNASTFITTSNRH